MGLVACVRVTGPSPAANAEILEALYQRCARLTPRIERHAEALVLDLAGSERLLLGGRFAVEEADVAESAAEAEWPAVMPYRADTLWKHGVTCPP